MSTGRISLFDSPLFLGFDHFEKTFDRLRKSSGEGYPPYNIEQLEDTGLRITLAVAGFRMDDLDVVVENNQLTVRGKRGLNGAEDVGKAPERIFLHRGIAERQFQRSFILADGVEVKTAELEHGLLHIELERVEPESRARRIPIGGGVNQENGKALSNGSQAIDVSVDDDKNPTKKSKK